MSRPTGLPLWLGGGVAALAAAAMLVGPLAPDEPAVAASPSPRPSPAAQPTPSPTEEPSPVLSPDATSPASPPPTAGATAPTAGGTAPPATGGTTPPATGGTAAPAPGGTAPPPVVPGAAPPAAGAAAVGSVVAAGAAILPLPADGLAASADQRATGTAVPVESVVSDEGFWIGSGPGERLFVQLQIDGESPFQVQAGQLVDLEGTVIPVSADPEAELGVDAAEGRDELVQQGFLILTDRLSLSEG